MYFLSLHLRIRCAAPFDSHSRGNVDFGFIQPARLANVMVDLWNSQTLPEEVQGKLVAESARDSM